jgi:nucleoside-diphosphate-sugar epimerase
MKTKVLVTGANGFLGKAVCAKVRTMDEYKLIPLNGKAEWDLTPPLCTTICVWE